MSENKILAKVMGQPITEADVDQMIYAMGQRGQGYQSPEGRAIILDQLISKKLLLLEAKKKMYELDEAFKAELERAKNELLASYAIEKVMQAVTVTDDEAKAFYEEHKAEMKSGPTVNASHILVDSEEKANAVMEEIKAGKSFEDAAKEHSSCPSSAQGGNLGDFGPGQMVPEFDQACFSMEVGELRGPIQTQFGFHIIRLNSKNEATELAFEQVVNQINNRVINDKRNSAFQSHINQLKILYPVDKLEFVE